jgi:predicted nucleic acid-binding protein
VPGANVLNAHVDTNILVAVALGDTVPMELIDAWLRKGTKAVASAQAWYEFLCGPPDTSILEAELERVDVLLEGRIIPADTAIASLAASLFNRTGRRRSSQNDCIIAATAIVHQSELFTLNVSDFERFEPFGLRLLR